MNTIAQIFPRTGRISGPEVADGAKPDVPTTDVENEKKHKTPCICAVVGSRTISTQTAKEIRELAVVLYFILVFQVVVPEATLNRPYSLRNFRVNKTQSPCDP